MTTPALNDALARAERVHDQAALVREIRRLGVEIDAALAGESAIFLTVMQGAMIFAGQLATSIAAPLDFDYVHATRYRGTTSGGELVWIKKPSLSFDGRTVLLVDDILDEGHTMAAIGQWCRAQGALDVFEARKAVQARAADDGEIDAHASTA
jgi:hypoxanthine phosphoribosyltransferase